MACVALWDGVVIHRLKRMLDGKGDVIILLWGIHSAKSLGPSLVLHEAGV
jgi:hypothetical protein